MTSATAQRLRALDLLKARGMLRLKEFVAEGIGPETLARLVREEAVVRPARGLYQLPDTQVEADAFAVTVADLRDFLMPLAVGLKEEQIWPPSGSRSPEATIDEA